MVNLDEILTKTGYNFKFSRLKDTIYQVGLASQSNAVATCYASGHRIDPFGSPTWHNPRHLTTGLLIPQGTFLEHAIKGGEEPEIWVMFKQGKYPSGEGDVDLSTVGTSHIDYVTVSLQFLRYHETYRSHIGIAFRLAWNKIPEVWRFATVVRNAIAHSGRITINDPNFRAVTWQGLTYDHSSNGREIQRELGPTDLLILLIHMDLELMEYEQGPMPPLPDSPIVYLPSYLAGK